jgi:hypothetical protein
MAFLLLFGLLLLAFTLGSWWLARRFWQQSSASAITRLPSLRTLAELVLLASLLNLLLYGVTAMFFLPWGQGAAHGKSPTPADWQQAHLMHEFCLLGLSGICGALFLHMHRGRAAALSWLTGCLVVIAGFRGLGIYQEWVDEHQALGLVQSSVKFSWLLSNSRGA